MSKKNNPSEDGDKVPQFLFATIACLGAFGIGTALGWTSPALKFLEDENSTAPIHIVNDKIQLAWVASATPIGAFFGALPAGKISDTIGRKYTIIIFLFPWLICWFLFLYIATRTQLYVIRFLLGIMVGVFCNVIPIYLTEIPQPSIRGICGTMFQIFGTIGILYDYILGEVKSWYILNSAVVIASFLILVSVFFLPESPVFYAMQDREAEAKAVLRRLRGPNYDVDKEYDQIIEDLEESAENKGTLSELFTKRRYKHALVIAAGLMLCQQLSGINIVIFYSEQIFKESGTDNPASYTIIVGILQLIGTISAGYLIENLGRKVLLLFSTAVMFVCLIIIGLYFYLKEYYAVSQSTTCWMPLLGVVFYTMGYATGLGPIPWVMFGEVLHPAIKALAGSIAVAGNWLATALVAFSFQPIRATIGLPLTFWLFAFFCVPIFLFVFFVVPETRGKPLAEIQEMLDGKKKTNSRSSS